MGLCPHVATEGPRKEHHHGVRLPVGHLVVNHFTIWDVPMISGTSLKLVTSERGKLAGDKLQCQDWRRHKAAACI
jgi:hypothetical protein